MKILFRAIDWKNNHLNEQSFVLSDEMQASEIDHRARNEKFGECLFKFIDFGFDEVIVKISK